MFFNRPGFIRLAGQPVAVSVGLQTSFTKIQGAYTAGIEVFVGLVRQVVIERAVKFCWKIAGSRSVEHTKSALLGCLCLSLPVGLPRRAGHGGRTVIASECDLYPCR